MKFTLIKIFCYSFDFAFLTKKIFYLLEIYHSDHTYTDFQKHK
ncbi:hypothetical protein CSC35_2221 [Enterobacter hormaechei]|nr:hypothetical protein CSC35_2221 [Enterobacter hormaechei]